MIKITISGGPHAGKTTLVKALSDSFPEAFFIPEAATIVIQREYVRHKKNSDYVPALPWNDYARFAPLVHAEMLALESAIPPSSSIVFQDRSFIDALGYLQLNQISEYVSETRRQIDAANYALTLFCEPVGEYAVSEHRGESYAESIEIRDALLRAHRESGFMPVQLPPVSVAERVALVQAVIRQDKL